jgi:hypothetical protein
MNNQTMTTIGFTVLELLLIFSGFFVTGWMFWVMAGMYVIMPIASITTLTVLLLFFRDPMKWVIRKEKKTDTVNIDLRLFLYYKDVFNRITTPNGSTKLEFWAVDGGIMLACLFLAQYHLHWGLTVVALVACELTLREWFVTTVQLNGEAFDQAFDEMSRALTQISEDEEAEDE